MTAACLVAAAALPVFAFHQVVLGNRTLQTSTSKTSIAGKMPSVNGLDDLVPGQARVLTNMGDPGSSSWQTEPWSKTVSAAYHNRTWPLWNPYQGAGTPLAANGQSAAFDPLMIGVFAHPSPRTLDLSIVGAYCIGSIAVFLLLRSLRTRRAAALTSSVVFSLGGYWFFFANNLFSRTYIYLPLLLLLANRAAVRRVGPWTFAFALATAGSVLVGMPEATFLVWTVVGVYVVYRVVVTDPANRWIRAGRLACGGALGVAMTAPLLALFVQYESLSFNTHRGDSAVGKGSLPLQSLVGWFGPNLRGSFENWDLPKAWVGGAAIALACLCGAATTRFLRARQVLPFGIATLALAWKIYGPGSSAVGGLPVLNQIRWVAFGTPVLQVLIAILAGIGLDALLRRQLVLRRLVVIVAVVLVAVLVMVFTKQDVRNSVTGHAASLLAFGTVATIFVIALVVRTHRTRRCVVPLIPIMLFAELAIFMPASAYAVRFDAFGSQPWFENIRSATSDHTPGTQPDRVFGLDGKLFPATASGVGIYDIRMLDALYVDRYYQYVKTFLDGRIFDRYIGAGRDSPESGTHFVANPMFDLLGVRYLLSGWSVPGSIVGDAAGLIDRPGTATGDVAVGLRDVGGFRRPVIVSTAGSTIWIPAPRADAIEIRGQVADLSDAAPVTFSVVGEAADGTRSLLKPTVTVDASSGSQLLSVPLTPGQYARFGFQVAAPNPKARGAWYDLSFVDSTGSTMGSQYRFNGRANLTSVWENSRAMPRAFVVHDVVRVKDTAAARARMLRSATRFRDGAHLVTDFDPATTAVVESDTAVATKPCSTPASVTFDSYTPSEIRLSVDSACAGVLVLTDTYFPGWDARVNGRHTEVLPTDLAFRGIAVPSGTSEVIIRYKPARFRLALLIASLSFLVGVAICFVPLVRQRRARASQRIEANTS